MSDGGDIELEEGLMKAEEEELEQTVGEDNDGVYAEPPFLRWLVRTMHVFDAVRTEHRPMEAEMSKDWQADEEILCSFECTQAIEQEYFPLLNFLGCLASREEMTHMITLTNRRVQITMDEAAGCWPSLDEGYERVGHSLCCLCGCIPKGISQSKIMSLGDIAGYSRIMSIPRIQVLSTYRFMLTMWAFVVVLTYGYLCVMSFQDVQDKIVEYSATLNEASISWIGVQFPAPPVPISAEKLKLANPPVNIMVEGGLMLVAVTIVAYVIMDRVMTWGRKFLGTILLVVIPVLVFTFFNLEILAKAGIDASYLQYEDYVKQGQQSVVELQASADELFVSKLSPYMCLLVVLDTCKYAAALLPLWLFIGRLYIVYFGVRTYSLTLNFANQVKYTVSLKKAQVDKVCEALARGGKLGPTGLWTKAVDVKGAGLMTSTVDMPVAIPGDMIDEIDFVAGGGAKVTNAAVAVHKETYAWFWGGEEIYQCSEVFIHSGRARTSLLTSMMFSTNPVPYGVRRIVKFAGVLLILNGVVNYLACGDLLHKEFCPPGPWGPKGELMTVYGFPFLQHGIIWATVGIIVILVPILAGCCYGYLELSFSWGSDSLVIQSTYEKAESFMATLLQATATAESGWVRPDRDTWPEEVEVGAWEEHSSISQPRVLKITSHRIAIIDGETTTTTYWRTGLTEADIGPLEWCDPLCNALPCQSARRPRESDLVMLSLNFGWEKALVPADALTGTTLKAVEEFTLPYEQATEILHNLDSVVGNYSHHVWSPDRVSW
jgi:hypothetical protein